MANLLRNRKRVFPLCRAPDGSAFQKCDLCGVSVAIAIYDMHECKLKQGTKGGKKRNKKCESFTKDEDQRKTVKCEDDGTNQTIDDGGKGFSDQPRSAFCFFMESLQKGNFLDVDGKGFEKWKCMSVEERSPFVLEAEKVNSAHENILLKEVQVEPLYVLCDPDGRYQVCTIYDGVLYLILMEVSNKLCLFGCAYSALNVYYVQRFVQDLMDDEADSAMVNRYDMDIGEDDDFWGPGEMYRLHRGYSCSWINDSTVDLVLSQ
ncbi:hypothetical protein C5167_013408 [Papaver somniferum]|uniref:HMG box domain-containing protein n=1 Tax=Papaver somniferum TaxID=3469 RepID=A0A4Y7J3M5_PAPSO|nr:hypothetical protein C5167_013408 [Papaver somniferum]